MSPTVHKESPSHGARYANRRDMYWIRSLLRDTLDHLLLLVLLLLDDLLEVAVDLFK